MHNRQTRSGDFMSEARRLAPKSLRIQMMLQTLTKFRSHVTRENLEKLRLLVEETKIRVGEMTRIDPDQPDDGFVGRDRETGMVLDGRGRHLTEEQRISERRDAEAFFRGELNAPQYQIDWETGEIVGRIVTTPDGSTYVEPLTLRDLFPEEKKSRQPVKKG